MQSLNAIVNYLESHLTEEIAVDKLARTLGLTEYHVRRIFTFFFGMTIGEYVKLRRLTCANQDLLDGASVTATAFKYGYQSLEGFSRAFKDFAGVTPSMVYSTRRQKVFLPFKTEVVITGGTTMEFKIVQKPAFYLAGVTKRVPIQFTGKNAAIVELAQSITANQRAHMDALKDMEPYAVLNASYDFDTGRMEESGELTQMIGVATTQAQVPDDLTRVAVAEHTWAIFPSRGVFPATMQTTWGQIYAEWLPQSGYELVAAPEIAYVDYTTPAENRSTEIWIAVQKIADSE